MCALQQNLSVDIVFSSNGRLQIDRVPGTLREVVSKWELPPF